MKIIQLTAENVKRLTAVQITPDRNLVQITGKNSAGKTSVLDAIWWALGGADGVQHQPIRKGQESARIELNLGSGAKTELIVERRFTESQSYLAVKTPEGARYPSPQKLLDDLLGSLTFDPLEFMRADARKQFDILRSLVNLPVDLDALKAADTADYEARANNNRAAKAKRAVAESIRLIWTNPNPPDESIDESALVDKLAAASEHNTQIERRLQNRKNAIAAIEAQRANADAVEKAIEGERATIRASYDRQIGELERQIEELSARLRDTREKALQDIEARELRNAKAAKDLREKADELQKKLDAAEALPEPIDVEALRADHTQAQVVNRYIAERKRRRDVEAEAEALEAASKALTDAMEARNQQRLDALAATSMPIDGLSFGDGTVVYNTLPLDQASDAEQLMVSTAIAAALNPKLRVLRIRDGSLLDDDAMLWLANFADTRDLQIWIERVDGSGTVGIVMEDGHVRGQEQLQLAEPPAKGKKKAQPAA